MKLKFYMVVRGLTWLLLRAFINILIINLLLYKLFNGLNYLIKSFLSMYNLLKYRGITHYPVMYREVSTLMTEFIERVEDTKP